MLRWMCGVTRRDNIRNEHIRGTTRVVHTSKKITEKRLKWYGHVRRMKEEHIVRRMLDVEIPGKRRRGRPNLRWKDACKRDMTEMGLKEDNTTNRAALVNVNVYIALVLKLYYLSTIFCQQLPHVLLGDAILRILALTRRARHARVRAHRA